MSYSIRCNILNETKVKMKFFLITFALLAAIASTSALLVKTEGNVNYPLIDREMVYAEADRVEGYARRAFTFPKVSTEQNKKKKNQ